MKNLSTVASVVACLALLVPIALSITCYKCRNMNNNNVDCGDPFRTIGEQFGKIEKRECPAYERCAKITGSNNRGESYLIRDCYRTMSFDARLGSYKDHKIQYYNDIVDGKISFCNVNLCNDSPHLHYRTKVLTVLISAVTTAFMLVLL